MEETIRADITPICRAMIEHFARLQALIMQLEDRYHIDGSAVEDAVAVSGWVDANGLATEPMTTELVADVLALITARVASGDQPAPQRDDGRATTGHGAAMTAAAPIRVFVADPYPAVIGGLQSRCERTPRCCASSAVSRAATSCGQPCRRPPSTCC